MSTYRGIVRIGEEGVILDAGGVNVRLEGGRENFTPPDGLFITVVGEQDGDTIRNAAPALRPEAYAAKSSGDDVEHDIKQARAAGAPEAAPVMPDLWNKLSKPIGASPQPSPERAPESGPTPIGKARVPWQAWYDE